MRGLAAALSMILAAGCGCRGGGGGRHDAAVDDAAATCAEATLHTGEATYYDADGSGNCGFDPSP